MIGDSILLLYKCREMRGAHKKFDALWIGPFKITKECGPNTFCLAYFDNTPPPIPYNRHISSSTRFDCPQGASL